MRRGPCPVRDVVHEAEGVVEPITAPVRRSVTRKAPPDASASSKNSLNVG
jgi:hypothetical protein